MEEAASVLDEQTLYRARPDMSIDGKRFVYSSTGGTSDQYSNLYVQPVAGGEPYKLTFYEHDAFHPRWSPDGEWIAYISNEHGVSHLELLETYGGERRKVTITHRRWKRPMGVLSVRTVDASTGKIAPARIHLTASDGKFYCPRETYSRFLQGALDHAFHTTGTFNIDVPVGTLSLVAVKGFEFWPTETEVEIIAGDVTRVELGLERMTTWRRKAGIAARRTCT